MRFLPAFRKKPAPTPSWLERQTGMSVEQWVAYVQRRIRLASKPTHDPRHDETNITKWIDEVTGYVAERVPEGGDENMWVAAVLGQVFMLWFVRVQRAKALDPRRPLGLRRRAMEHWLNYCLSVTQLMLDERSDPKMFPMQEWENPYSPDARDGDFV